MAALVRHGPCCASPVPCPSARPALAPTSPRAVNNSSVLQPFLAKPASGSKSKKRKSKSSDEDEDYFD